jgi:hypothetical protein
LDDLENMVRFKNRYFLVEFQWEDKHTEISAYHILTSIKDSVSLNFGDFGYAALLFSLQGMSIEDLLISQLNILTQ